MGRHSARSGVQAVGSGTRTVHEYVTNARNGSLPLCGVSHSAGG